MTRIEGKLPPPPEAMRCPLCTFEGACDSGCPACGVRFYRVVTLREPEGQRVVAAPRPSVIAAARRIKRALHAEADRVAGIDTRLRRPRVEGLPALQAQLAVRHDLPMRVVADILDEVEPMLALLADVRAVIDRSVADRTALAAIDGWAEVRDLLYPDTDVARQLNVRRRMTPAERAAEREAADAAEREAWQIPSDIPAGPATCDECGATLAEVTGHSASGGTVSGVACPHCNGIGGPGTALDDDELAAKPPECRHCRTYGRRLCGVHGGSATDRGE